MSCSFCMNLLEGKTNSLYYLNPSEISLIYSLWWDQPANSIMSVDFSLIMFFLFALYVPQLVEADGCLLCA